MNKTRRSRSSEPEEKIETKAVIEEPKDEVESTKSEETKDDDEVTVVSRPKKIVRKGTTKSSRPQVKYREVVYLGTADKSTVRGAVTGNKYTFIKDEYDMPVAVNVDERDYPAVIALKGKGCARRDPRALFMNKQDWDLEIASAKRANS
jgi:hypothetical protein